MSETIRSEVDSLIEKELERHISIISKVKNPIKLLGEFIESFYSKGDFGQGESYRPALDILVSKLERVETSKDKPTASTVQHLIEACEFARNYYHLRDLIYYSYSIPGSIVWTRNENNIEVEVTDPTIFRQIIAEMHNFLMSSKEDFRDKPKVEDIKKLLHSAKTWDFSNPKVVQAIGIVEDAVEIKVNSFFSYIPSDSLVDIGGYSYQDFLKVYKVVLTLSLYERYYSSANKLSCVISYPEIYIVQQLSAETGVEEATVQRILRDIASSSRGTFNYFLHEQQYYLFPNSFSLKDGIGAILRQFAQRNGNAFSSGCGIIIGDSIVDRIASSFDVFSNFIVLKDVKLQKFGAHLPDIDVLAISYEPSLGFHFYVAEVKNSLPATWSKDYLKATGNKGYMEKAISQIEKIKTFFETVQGAHFIKDLIEDRFSHLDFETIFPDGYTAVMSCLIVTSQSIGMFYPSLDLVIINEAFLREILKKSDGDVLYIQHFTRNLEEIIDSTYERKRSEFSIEGINISCDVVSLSSLISFEENQYLSAGVLEQLEREAMLIRESFKKKIGDDDELTS